MKPTKYTVDKRRGLVYVGYKSKAFNKTVEYDNTTHIDLDVDNNIMGIEFITYKESREVFAKVKKILEEYKQDKLESPINKKDLTK